MKKLVAIVLALALTCASVFAISGCTPKQSDTDITAVAFMQKDQAGNELFTVEIVDNESDAQLTITGPALSNGDINGTLDKKSYSSIQKTLSKQKFETWTSLSDGQAMQAPAGGFAMVVQRRDGTVLGATSETLSPEAISLASDQISSVITDFVLNRLGIELGVLEYLL